MRKKEKLAPTASCPLKCAEEEDRARVDFKGLLLLLLLHHSWATVSHQEQKKKEQQREKLFSVEEDVLTDALPAGFQQKVK